MVQRSSPVFVDLLECYSDEHFPVSSKFIRAAAKSLNQRHDRKVGVPFAIVLALRSPARFVYDNENILVVRWHGLRGATLKYHDDSRHNEQLFCRLSVFISFETNRQLFVQKVWVSVRGALSPSLSSSLSLSSSFVFP